MSLTLAVITALTIKHFICDFPLQSHPWLYSHKGSYGHPGGLTHAMIHAVGTLIALPIVGVSLGTAALLALADFAIHYHIDYAKMKLNAVYGWTPATSAFWVLLGADQLAHYLTYIGFAWVIG